MVKEIVSRKIKILVSLKQIQKRRKEFLYRCISRQASSSQPTIPQYDSLLAISQKERANGNVSRADSTRALIYLYIYGFSIGFVNRMWQKRWRVKRSILHGLLKGCDGPEAAGAGGAWLRFRFGESDGRRRRRRWGGAAPLPPPVQPTVPQSRAEPAGWPSASAQPAVPQTRRLLEHRDRRSEKGAGGFELVERGATVQQKAQAGAAGQSHAAGDVPSSSASTAGILHSVNFQSPSSSIPLFTWHCFRNWSLRLETFLLFFFFFLRILQKLSWIFRDVQSSRILKLY